MHRNYCMLGENPQAAIAWQGFSTTQTVIYGRFDKCRIFQTTPKNPDILSDHKGRRIRPKRRVPASSIPRWIVLITLGACVGIKDHRHAESVALRKCHIHHFPHIPLVPGMALSHKPAPHRYMVSLLCQAVCPAPNRLLT